MKVCVAVKSVFNGVGGKIFLYHESNLKNNSVVKFPKVEPGELFDFFKAVNKSVPVYEKLAAGFGNVEVVFKEFLNSEKGLLVKALDGPFFEYLFEEHLAKSGGKLIDKSCDAEVVVAHDSLVGVENLSDLKGDLRFLEALGKVLDTGGGSADADVDPCKELASESVNNGAGELFKVGAFDARANFFNKNNVGFAYAENEVLGFVREKILHYVKNGNVVDGKYSNEKNDARNVGGEAKLPRFDVNIAGKNVVKNYVFDKIRPVVFFVVILLDSRKGNRHKGTELSRKFVRSGNENRVFGLVAGAERFICKSVPNVALIAGAEVGNEEVVSFSDSRKVAAGNYRRAVINDTHGAADAVMRLMYYTLK